MNSKIAPVRVNPALRHPSECRISLSGEWRFRLDPEDAGTSERWFDNIDKLADAINVPGCWQGQGFGHDGRDTIGDFQITTRIFRATYKGTGWYGKEFDAPSEWRGKRIWLNFGGVHPSAEVWLNGVKLGENELPYVPFGFDITDSIRWGEKNFIVVRVHEHNREFGHLYNWEGNWSGLYRDVEMTATGETFMETCAVYPDADTGEVRVSARIGGKDDSSLIMQTVVSPVESAASIMTIETPVSDKEFEFNFNIPSPRLWCPETPALYRVDITLRRGNEVVDAWSERVGFVKFAAEGKQLCINNQPYFWLGSGDHFASPESGSPDANRDRWRRKLKVLRQYGYMMVRCPSFIYTPEYFDAADEAGIIIQSEPGGIAPWGGTSAMHTYSWPKPTPDNYPILKEQWELCILRDVNHPSANIYSMSNEFGQGTGYHFPRIAWEFYRAAKAIKPTALVIWTDGAYDKDMPGDFVNGEVVCDEGAPLPLIQHEFRWWSSFPDIRIRHKYTGAVLPFAIDIAQHSAEHWGLAHLLPEIAVVSQRLQFLEMKGKLEMMRRDHLLAGISHFNAMDTGASPQGVVDQFYEHKYASPELWLQTNNDTVVLSGLNFDDRVLRSGDTFRTTLHVSDYSHPALDTPVLDWRLVVGDEEIATGRINFVHQPFGTHKVGEIEAKVPTLTNPAAARLEARLSESSRIFTNSWDLWILPPDKQVPQGLAIYGAKHYSWLKDIAGLPMASAADLRGINPPKAVITEAVDATLVEYMKAGGRVILSATEGMVRPHPPLATNYPYNPSIKYFFTPPANYGPYEDGQNGTIIRNNPMLGGLPHEGFADLQLFRLIEDSPPIDLAPLYLNDIEPVIRVIHRYPVFHPLAYLLEARVGSGGLIICSLDLNPEFAEARYLFGQICEYAVSYSFSPAEELSDKALNRIVHATALP